MAATTHEVPTHLNVEDKVLLGLTVRQCLYLLVGCSASYGLWGQLAAAPDLLRVSCVLACGGLAMAFALLRPGGRALEEWLAATLLFIASPRQATWAVEEPSVDQWRPAGGAWQELVPSPTWAEEIDE